MQTLSVIKIGGNIIDDEQKLANFIRDFSRLEGQKILVHGGGKLATRLAEKLEIPQQMLEGRRITDSETLKIITMVYAGYINKQIVAGLQAAGCNAIGLSGADGNLVRAHKRTGTQTDYGFVGDIDEVNLGLLSRLLSQNLCPVLAPVTHDKKGQLLNTNADTLASELARSLCSEFRVQLVYCFEKRGVLLHADDDHSLVPSINTALYKQMKEEGKIFAGMIPKLDNAFSALRAGVSRVLIGRAEELITLISGSAGTTILND